MLVNGHLNPDIVGQSAYALGKLFGVNAGRQHKVLIGEIEKIGDDEPLSHVRRGAQRFDACVEQPGQCWAGPRMLDAASPCASQHV